MDELYKRVLAHVPTLQLHLSYNAVLQQEFSSVNVAMDDVVATFGKLEEVRNAVAQLEQGHESTGGRNANLMAHAANAMLLQCELEGKANRLATGMKMMKLERKRKREEELEHESRTSRKMVTNGVELSKEQCGSNMTKSKVLQLIPAVRSTGEGRKAVAPVTRNNRLSSVVANRDVVHEVASNSNSVSSSLSESGSEDDDNDDDVEAALKALMTQGTEKRVVSRKSEVPDKLSSNAALATTQPKGESAVFMKTIVEEVNKLSPQQRGYVISDVLISLKESLEEDIGGTHQSEVVSSLIFLVGWWAGESEHHIEHLGLYRDYITTVKSYVSRLPRSSQRTALQRLIDSLASAIKQFVALLKPNAAMKVKRVCPTVDMAFAHDVGSVDSSAKRYQSLVRVLAAFKKEISVNIRDGYDQRIFKPLNKLFRWLCEDQREPYQLHVYRMFVRAAKQHANQILDADARANFIRILERMSEVITDPSSLKTRKFLTDIRQRAGEVLQKLKRFHGKGLHHSKLHNLVAEVARLVDYTTYGWNPRQDLTIRKCVKELKEIIMSLDLKPGVRKQRFAQIAKWKVDDPPATIKVPATKR